MPVDKYLPSTTTKETTSPKLRKYPFQKVFLVRFEVQVCFERGTDNFPERCGCTEESELKGVDIREVVICDTKEIICCEFVAHNQ